MAAPKIKGARTGGSPRRTRAVGKRSKALLVEAAGGGAAPVAIPVRPKTFRTLAARPRSMRALIEGYGAALERSRISGRPVRLVVDVAPHGAPTITPVEAPRPAEAAAEPVPAGGTEAALSAARERGRHRVAEILSGPEMLSAHEFAELIGTSRVTVNARRQARQVLGLEGAKRGYRFPEWQVGEDGRPFAALPELFGRLGDSPWSVYRFLVQHHPELGGLTGREALRRGRVGAVLEAAEAVARGDFA
jgi:hypothetical protein